MRTDTCIYGVLCKGLKFRGPLCSKLFTVSQQLKKGLNDPDNHDDVVIHLEPDILECEVKWELGSIITKLVEVMEFQLSYLKSQKMIL